MVVPWGGSGRGNSGGGNSSGGNSGKGNSSGGNSAKGEIQIKLDSEPEQEGMQPSISGEISVGVASADWSSETAELSVAFDVGFGRGGITIDTNTGEIVEQTAGFSLAGFFDYDVTELRCEKILTVRFKFLTGLIGWSYTEREFLKDKPGCELPEPEPDPEPDPLPPPPPVPNLDEELEGWFVFGVVGSAYFYEKSWYGEGSETKTTNCSLAGLEIDNENKIISFSYVKNNSVSSTYGYSYSNNEYISVSFVEPSDKETWNVSFPGTLYFYDYASNTIGALPIRGGWWKEISSSINGPNNGGVLYSFTKWKNVKNYIINYNIENQDGGSTPDGTYTNIRNYGIKILYFPGMPALQDEPPKTPPLPPTPPQIDMDDCCKTTLKLLKEIHKALGVKRLLSKGFSVPNRLMMPRTTGTSTAKNFLEIAEIQLRVTDNLGIHPFNVVVKDADPTKAGDQPLYENINSGSYALKEILQYLIDINADGDANTNVAVRSAYLQTQMMTTLASQSKKIDCLIDGLGIGTKQSQEKILVPFNPGVNGKAKGFDPKKAQIIDNNSEMTTEALLPELLQSRELPFPTEKFIGKHDIMELLYAIYAQTSKQ